MKFCTRCVSTLFVAACLPISLASDFMKGLLDNMDLSGDGTIHWHEVKHSSGFTDLPGDVQKSFRKAFLKADVDRNHVLTFDEFEVFYKKNREDHAR
mmetsp:Transcript_41671/g.74739  ORF Transcript_41671/g.74739 Transcript_41671/m.74739 type:complete len:97 (-) Transcript_41671:372-662(-)